MTSRPYYFRSLDFEQLVTDYPLGPDYGGHSGQPSSGALRALQDSRLRQRVEEAWRNPFHSRRLAAAGLGPSDVQSVDDLYKLPIFDAVDLKESLQERPPFGLHQAEFEEQRGKRPFKMGTSGGTTGKPRPTLFDPLAWEVQAIQAARALWFQGARPGDVVQIPRTNSLANAGWQFYAACHHWLGAMPLTTGSGVVTPSESQLDYALTYGTNGWSARGEYLARLVKVAEGIGFDLHQLPTRYLSATMGTDTEGRLRQRLQDAWNAPVFDGYGTNEIGLIAFECSAQDGLHVQEDSALVEVVDRETREPVAAGQEGVLVVTSIHRTMPLMLRFDTSDLFRLYDAEPCPCGLTTRKLSCFLGRADEMIKLRGQNIFPRSALSVITKHPGANGEYLCVVSRTGDEVLGVTEMTVRVERASLDIDADELESSLTAELSKFWGARVGVSVEDPDVLAPLTGLGGEGKVKRLLDLRK